MCPGGAIDVSTAQITGPAETKEVIVGQVDPAVSPNVEPDRVLLNDPMLPRRKRKRKEGPSKHNIEKEAFRRIRQKKLRIVIGQRITCPSNMFQNMEEGGLKTGIQSAVLWAAGTGALDVIREKFDVSARQNAVEELAKAVKGGFMPKVRTLQGTEEARADTDIPVQEERKMTADRVFNRTVSDTKRDFMADITNVLGLCGHDVNFQRLERLRAAATTWINMALDSAASAKRFRAVPPCVTLVLALTFSLEVRHKRGDPQNRQQWAFWKRSRNILSQWMNLFLDTSVVVSRNEDGDHAFICDASPDLKFCHTAFYGMMHARVAWSTLKTYNLSNSCFKTNITHRSMLKHISECRKDCDGLREGELKIEDYTPQGLLSAYTAFQHTDNAAATCIHEDAYKKDLDLLFQATPPDFSSDPWIAINTELRARLRVIEDKVDDFSDLVHSRNAAIKHLTGQDRSVKEVPPEGKMKIARLLADFMDYFRSCMEIAERMVVMDISDIEFDLDDSNPLLRGISSIVEGPSAKWATRMLILFTIGMLGNDSSARLHLVYEGDILTYLLNRLDRNTGNRKPGASHSRKAQC